MQDGRKQERRSVVVRGWVTGSSHALMPCTVEDMSVGGAKLVFEKGQPLDEFKLFFSPHAENFRSCIVRWRKDNAVGVKFEVMPQAATLNT
jgi:hypothetical protein